MSKRVNSLGMRHYCYVLGSLRMNLLIYPDIISRIHNKELLRDLGTTQVPRLVSSF